MKWNTDDIAQSVDIFTKDGDFSENETREAHNYILDAWIYYHDKTPLTVEMLCENGFVLIGRVPERLYEKRVGERIIQVSAKPDGDQWPWWCGDYRIPPELVPTTLGELRQLIRKIEGSDK